jgi:hypothetical protein
MFQSINMKPLVRLVQGSGGGGSICIVLVGGGGWVVVSCGRGGVSDQSVARARMRHRRMRWRWPHRVSKRFALEAALAQGDDPNSPWAMFESVPSQRYS